MIDTPWSNPLVPPTIAASLGTRRRAWALAGLAVVAAVGYWLLWVPAYRLNERFEYTDLLISAWPWVTPLLAAALRLVGAAAPAALTSYHGTAALFMVLFVLQFAIYLLALRLIGRLATRRAVGIVLGFTACCQLVLLPLPGVFTTDLFSYAMYGEIAGRFGGSPYVQAPDHYPTHPLYLLINPLWRDAPSVYGPVWIGLSSVVGALWGGQIFGETLAFRLIADLCHWINLAILWWGLRRLQPGHEPLGLALYAWNPLIVLEFAGNGHNDGTMLTFLLLAMGLVARGRDVLGTGALVLSVATKYTTVLLLPPLLWWSTRDVRGWRRLLLVAGGGALALAALALLYLPWWRGPATLGPVQYWLTTPLYANYAPIGVAVWVRDLLVAANWGSVEAVEPWVFGAQRQLCRVGFLAFLTWETLRLRRAGDLPLLSARVLLVFLLAVNTWVLPWYYSWPLALAALGDPRSRTTWLVVGFSLSAPLSMYWAQTRFTGLEPLGYVVYLAPLAVLLLAEAGRRGWRLAPPGLASSGGRAAPREAYAPLTATDARSAAAADRRAAPLGPPKTRSTADDRTAERSS